MDTTPSDRPRFRSLRAFVAALILTLAVLTQFGAQVGAFLGATHSSVTVTADPTDDSDYYYAGDGGGGGGG
jgi:hypothetical protein